MNIGIIMAGGSGSRMDSELPKQFIEVGGKPLILYSLTKFLESGFFDAVYIGMHPDWVEYMGNLISGLTIPPYVLHIISGGEDRNSTLLNVLDAVESELRDSFTSDTAHISEYAEDSSPYGYGADPIIVTHDAARPFVTIDMLEKSIEAARSAGASTLAIPATDTIAVAECVGSVDAQGAPQGLAISNIPDRKNLYNIQTPQSFKLSAFREAYSMLTTEQIASLTDACGVFVYAGKPVSIVLGKSTNLKITTPLDLRWAETVL